MNLVAEAVRICKVPNWWHPESGEPDYIYQSLIGQRQWPYIAWDRTAETLQQQIVKAVDEQDRAMAIGGVMAFGNVQPTFGSTKQANALLKLAQDRQHAQAERLISIHLSARSALCIAYSGRFTERRQQPNETSSSISNFALCRDPVSTAAVANDCLDSINFDGRGCGDINSSVAQHMTQGASFDVIEPCNVEAYRFGGYRLRQGTLAGLSTTAIGKRPRDQRGEGLRRFSSFSFQAARRR